MPSEAGKIFETLSTFIARVISGLTVFPIQVTVELCLCEKSLWTEIALIRLLHGAVVPLLMTTQPVRSVELFQNKQKFNNDSKINSAM